MDDKGLMFWMHVQLDRKRSRYLPYASSDGLAQRPVERHASLRFSSCGAWISSIRLICSPHVRQDTNSDAVAHDQSLCSFPRQQDSH